MKLLTAAGHDTQGVLLRMANTYDKQNAVTTAPAYTKGTCHFLTISTALKRGNSDDKIWLFGDKASKAVMHSVLTDEDNRVVADTFAKNGKFTTKEYIRNDLNGESYDLVSVTDMQSFLDDYMDYSFEASTLAIEAAPKDFKAYSFFKLKRQLRINFRGQEILFRRGDNMGWRFSSNGKFFRLVGYNTGPNKVFSIKITDESLKWLVGHDPKARRK